MKQNPVCSKTRNLINIHVISVSVQKVRGNGVKYEEDREK